MPKSDAGVIYVAYGVPAMQAARESAAALIESWPVAVVSDQDIGIGRHIWAAEADRGARWAKLSVDEFSPWEYTCYLDADTVPVGDISAGFEMLRDGWEIVITPSEKQGRASMWHVGDEEKNLTLQLLGYEPLQLQGGVFFFRKCERVHDLFKAWRSQWQTYKDKDQAALLRAMNWVQPKMWLLGRDWNGGSIIEHHFGKARR